MKRPSHRAGLVARVLEGSGGGPDESGRIPPRGTGAAPAPLAAAQRRLWILHRLAPWSAGSNRPLGLTLSGPLDGPALARTLTELVRRHEALRTTFPEIAGEPVQMVQPPAPLPIEPVDLRHLPPGERAAEARRIATAAAERPFDLARGPVIRAVLLRLGSEEHVLLLLMHHIVFDGWSERVLVGELASLYHAFAIGEDSPLPELPIQPADFALWERRQLEGERLQEHLRYWRELLAPLPPPLTLAGDHAARAAPTSRGAEVRFRIPPPVSGRLRAWSRQERLTPFMTLVTAFQVLLGRHAGQDEFLFGVPVAGRTRAETEGLVGCFMNIVLLRADLTGRPSFRELAARTRSQTLDSFAHQALPFERLVEELQPERRPDRWPLCDVLFQVRNLPKRPPAPAGGLRIGFFHFERTTIEGPSLSLQVDDGPGGLDCSLAYAAERFRAEAMRRLTENYLTVLTAALDQPDRPAALLPLERGAEARGAEARGAEARGAEARGAEARGLFDGGNRAGARWDASACIHEVLEQQAARTPEAVALAFGTESLSYAELNARANRLAHHLRGLGVGPEVIVALCLERSVELIVALLGVLKAGGAYLPLALNDPPGRIRAQLEDAKVGLLLTQERHAGGLPEDVAAVVPLDREAERIAGEPSRNPRSVTTGTNLAYVLYTSGSTGAPKGVAVSHAGVVRLVREQEFIPLGPDEVLLQLAPVAFDASSLEIWGALLNGARLVVAPPGVLSPEEIGELLVRHGITTLWLTAGLFQLMVDARLPGFGGIRRLLSGGDVLPIAHVRRVLDELPGCRLVNLYGPTEITTAATTHVVARLGADEAAVPIGRPIAGSRVYLLDPDLRPVPVGVPAELFVGGMGVARGYLGQPRATAERFLPDPFGDPGARLYRTGDRARWRPDGVLEFLGRLDRQVKIRGFRVEPGEIEAALGAHPAVAASAVVARREPGDDKRLVAFVVPAAGEGPTPADLRTFLQGRVPDYMVPATIELRTVLPLDRNGKIDRQALARASSAPDVREPSYVPPRTPTEELVAGIWGEVLRREPIGARDDFFSLGGHSLLAVQVLSRAMRSFEIELPMRAIFEAPTVAALAERIDEARRAPAGRRPSPLVRVPRVPRP